jgi:hypothetical protein
LIYYVGYNKLGSQYLKGEEMKKYRYTVRVSPRSTIVTRASNATAAKSKVWSEIKDGYTYGFHSWKAFMKGTTARRG